MEPHKAQATNIRDVARAAGVSHQTVSRVLNDHPNISASTRARVEATMERLSYRPSRVAQALATSRSRTIGIISTDNGRYGPPKTQRAIEAAILEQWLQADANAILPNVQSYSRPSLLR